MPGDRLALVADDPRLADVLQEFLRQRLGEAPLPCRFDAVGRHLGPDADGLMVLAAATPADADAVVRLVQEIYLQKLPTLLLLVEGDTLPAGRDFAPLEPYLAERFRWPEDAEALAAWVGQRLPMLLPLPGTHAEAPAETIHRRLLAMTPSLLPFVEHIALVAMHDVTVLLTGETGTGKTFLARLMHESSPRRGEPFVVVACGAQTPNLIESTFFGHMKGAFTSADRNRIGKFAAAAGGTILLDEIDTLGLEQQASLLRVIETGEFEPVGSNETQLCRARIIVASNWNLEEAVACGKLRADLYYRLNVMSFHLPPLRERVQDVAPLVRGLAARFNTKFRKELFDVSPEALGLLESYHWPGNLRQLENVVQQAVLVSSGPELLPQHLPEPIRRDLPRDVETAEGPQTIRHGRLQAERVAIQRALANNNNSRTRAAQELGITRVTLYKKMDAFGLIDDSRRRKRSS